jgi:hypothetical protein
MQLKQSILILSLFLTLLIYSQIASAKVSLDEQNKALIGLTISEVIALPEYDKKTLKIIDEPPGVARAISIEHEYRGQLWLYFDRYFDEKRNWDLEKIKKMKIKGVALKYYDKWYKAGEIIGRYHIDSK